MPSHKQLRTIFGHRAPLWRVLFWTALGGSYVLSILPGDVVAPLFHWSDKLNHAGAFLVLGFLLRMGWRIPYVQAFAVLVAYGGFIEISQLFAVHRSAEWADLAADTVGVVLGLKLYRLLYRFFDPH